MINLLWIDTDSHSGVTGVIAVVLDVISRRVAAALRSSVKDVGIAAKVNCVTFVFCGTQGTTVLFVSLVVAMVTTGVIVLDWTGMANTLEVGAIGAFWMSVFRLCISAILLGLD